MKWTLFAILLIIGLMCAIVIAIIIVSKIHEHVTPSGGGGGQTQNCSPNQDVGLMIKCDPNDPKSCDNCSGPSSCYVVDKDHPYYYTYGSLPNQKIAVPDGTWCLPTKTTTLPCNQFSGYPVLVRLNSQENAWACHCRYPNLFQNKGALGNCTFEVACGYQTGDGQLVCPKGSKYCTPDKPWVDQPTYDPIAGVCKCKDGLKYADFSIPDQGVYIKACVQDTCTPGKEVDGKCDCGKPQKHEDGTYTSYIRCPDDIIEGQPVPCTTDSPMCLDDPCNPAGYYDNTTLKCVCTYPGTAPKENENSPVGWVCESPCDPAHNPCGNRGTCYLDQIKGDTVAKCKDCLFPWIQDKDNLCQLRLKDPGESCENDSQCFSGNCSPEWGWTGPKICS